MKRRLFTSLILILLLSCCKPTHKGTPVYFNQQNDWQKENLFSNVKSIEVFTASINTTTNKTEQPVKISSKKYTNFGMLTHLESFNQYGQKEYELIKKYNKMNKLSNTEETNILLFRKNKQVYHYTDDSSEVIIKHFTNDSLNYIAVNKFDANKNLIATTKTNGEDSIIIKYIFTLDSLNRDVLQRSVTIAPNGRRQTSIQKKFDSNGNLIEIINDKGTFGKTTLINTFSDHILLKTKRYNNGFIESVVEYDANYNPVVINRFISANLVRQVKYKYKYDSNGNWTNRNKYIKDLSLGNSEFILSLKELRKIEYYH